MNTVRLVNIKLNNIGLFRLNVLFIGPNVNYELLNLQKQFQSDFADGLEWTAHTTMLIDEPKIIQEAIPYIAENFTGFVGKIKYISLYEFWPSRFISREVLL